MRQFAVSSEAAKFWGRCMPSVCNTWAGSCVDRGHCYDLFIFVQYNTISPYWR